MQIQPTLPSNTLVPNNGPLSGMIIPAVTGVAALAGGLLSPEVRDVFAAQPSEVLRHGFLASICLMTAHKLESYLTHEYKVCPVYLTNAQSAWGKDPRQAMFVSFVATFLGMSFVSYLMMEGSPWPMLLLSVWMAQGLHELHHSAKSLARGSYYSGTISALLFTGFTDWRLFPEWYAQLNLHSNLGLTLFYAVQPIVFGAFYLEHKDWMKKLAQLRMPIQK